MAIPKFLQDLAIISKLGDNPGSDNNLTTSGLRAKFDEAGLAIQNYINNTLIPALSGLANPEEGLNMKANIVMGGNKVTGLGTPTAEGDAVPLGYANQNFAPAVESAYYPGCYYRTVDGVVEWLNPPMAWGVEYRTTERFNGKPVCKKLVNISALPNSTTLTVSHGTTVLCPISIDLASQNNTVNLNGHKNITECKFNATDISITTNADFSAFQAFALLTYTKQI